MIDTILQMTHCRFSSYLEEEEVLCDFLDELLAHVLRVELGQEEELQGRGLGHLLLLHHLECRCRGRRVSGGEGGKVHCITGFQLMGNKQFRMEFFLETSVCVDFSQYPFENIYVSQIHKKTKC